MLTFALLLTQLQDPPTSAYDALSLEGWNIKIQRTIRTGDRDLYDKTVALLKDQLKLVVKVLPQEKTAKLRQTTIWVDANSRGTSAMVYHPSRQWLIENHYNPDKAQCVEVSHPDKFLAWIKDQPYMVLHELAHAYHDQVLGFNNKRVADAYKTFVDSKKYDLVAHINGSKQKHYGLNNPQEFFAEMTESYFGKNDFYPFNRTDLKSYDPDTYKFIEKEWLLR